jgi:hypothetical protein
MGSTEIVVSSVCLSVSYFSAAIAPRELKFWTKVYCFTVVNSTVRNLGSVALGQSSSVISLKNNSFFETSVISFSQKSKNVLPFSVATWNFLFIYFKFCSNKTSISRLMITFNDQYHCSYDDLTNYLPLKYKQMGLRSCLIGEKAQKVLKIKLRKK